MATPGQCLWVACKIYLHTLAQYMTSQTDFLNKQRPWTPANAGYMSQAMI